MKVRNFCFHVEVFHKPAQNKFRFQPEIFGTYQMDTMHSMKEVLMAEERSVIKFYEVQFLNERGRCIKGKKQETASRLISTILHFNTFKDCTAYVTFPHCTAANMTEDWTLLVVCTSTFIMYIHKKYLCNSWPYFSHFWICLTKKFLYSLIF